jgi:PAS domain S-box-containing protein
MINNEIQVILLKILTLCFYIIKVFRMQADDRAKDELLKLYRAVECSDEAIFMTDPDGLIIYINPGFTNLYGYSSEEIVRKTTPRILKSGKMTEEDYKYFWSTLLSKDSVRGELINKTRDGKLLSVEGSANPILNNMQEIIGFIGIQHDISSRKQSEEALKKSEEKFRKASMTSPDSINITRLSDGMMISINEAFTRILGYTEDEVIGKTTLELNLWADQNDRNHLVKKLLEHGKVEDFETIFLKKDGSIIYGLLSASLIELDGATHILTVTKDISLRKQVEEKLIREQFLINALMNSLTDHVYFKDLESRFIRNNRAHALSFGFNDPDQLVGKSDFDFFAEHAARQAFNDEQKIIKTGEPVLKEERLTRKDGTVAWFSATKLPLRDNLGKIIGTFGISRDITEWKMTEEALKHSEERFRSVTQSANDAIITIDNKGFIQGWNKGAENMFGYEETEILGKSLNIVIPEDYLNKHIKPKVLLEIRGVQPSANKTVELLGLKKSGVTFPVELSLSIWETSEGKFFTGIVRDITSRKRTELENLVNYEITQGITSTSNLDELMKLIHLSLGKVVYAENFFIALYNQKTELFSFPYFIDKIDETPLPTSMKKSCSAFVFHTVKPLLLTQDIFDKLAEKGEVELVGSNSPSWIGIPLQTPSKVIGVLVLQHYEKENVYSEGDVRFLTSIGSQIALAIERKKAEEEIKLKNELLQAMNAEKDKFFSIIAHDLRGPLSAFVDATQIITEEVQAMSVEEIRDITESMKTSATNIYSLLENLLEWSRLRRGTMDFIPEKLNLKKKTETCIDVLTESARKKGIHIEVEIPSELEILADSQMLETVIRNLVSNAVKFTTHGGIIKVSASSDDNQSVIIKIIDSGIGMPGELKDKLFRINEKTNRPGTDGEPSTGLGLLLCKEFIDKHNGKIWVESDPGKGSTFAILIPEK